MIHVFCWHIWLTTLNVARVSRRGDAEKEPKNEEWKKRMGEPPRVQVLPLIQGGVQTHRPVLLLVLLLNAVWSWT